MNRHQPFRSRIAIFVGVLLTFFSLSALPAHASTRQTWIYWGGDTLSWPSNSGGSCVSTDAYPTSAHDDPVVFGMDFFDDTYPSGGNGVSLHSGSFYVVAGEYYAQQCFGNHGSACSGCEILIYFTYSA